MINWVIKWSLSNRGLILLLAALLCLLGWRAIHKTPIDAIPDLSDVQVIIKTRYPGQAPSVVEQQVTYPLSSALLSVPGAHTVRGFSFYGDSYIYVIFDEGTDIYWARSRVLEYLDQAASDLPPNAKPELGPDASGVGWVFMYALRDTTGKHDLSELRSIQDWLLKFELQAVPGVAEVASVGGMVKQYRITVDPLKLQYYQVPLSHVRRAIQQSNGETGLSVIELAEAEYMLRATGYIDSAEALREVPLGVRHQDIPLFLHHIAKIEIVPAMRRGVAELNGQGEVTGGIVVMRHGENAQATIGAIKTKLEQLQKALPDGVEVVPVYDRSILITRAVNHLWSKVVQELLLVGILMFVFLLSVRSVLVAMISLPIGILASFTVMQLQGVNANIMSLGGIAIAIGAMVDGAIVMIENLHRRLEQNDSASHWQKVYDSACEVGPTLFFSLLIITISFLPVFTLEAEEGRLFAPLALTKTYAMGAAAIFSVTLMPVLLFYLVRRNAGVLNVRRFHLTHLYSGLLEGYKKGLVRCLQYPALVLSLVVLALVASIYPLKQLSSEFMPPLDEGDLMYMPTTLPGISIGKARELLQQTDKIIRTLPEVENVFGKVGRADTATDPAPLTMIETFIQLKPKTQWRAGMTTQDLIDELERKVKFPGLSNAWVMPIKTRIDMLATGMKTPLGIKLAGPDPVVLQALGEQLEGLLADFSETRSVYAERSAGGRYLNININKQTAAQFNLTVADIHRWLQMSVAGVAVAESIEGVERYPISIRFPDHYRDTPERLMDLPIMVENGAHIRLADVAELRMETGPPMIKSENARINTWIYLDIGDADIDTFVQKAESVIDQSLNWPKGYTLRWSGQYESMQRVRASLSFIIPLTLGIIAVLLYLNFRRFTDVVVLLGSLPFALVGGLLFVYWLDFKLSVAVAVGFIALAGLAVETGAIMLQVLRSRVDAIGESQKLLDAVVASASQRLRPVIMTAVSTIGGLLPVMIGQEPGAEIMGRIAAPIIGGLTTSVLLTLFVLPVIFLLIQRRHFGEKME